MIERRESTHLLSQASTTAAPIILTEKLSSRVMGRNKELSAWRIQGLRSAYCTITSLIVH